MALKKWGNWTFVDLMDDELAEIDRQVNGTGGFENFLRRLQKQVNHAAKTIKLSHDDLAAIPHFAFDYKEGGFEHRLRKVFERELGPNLGRVVEPTQV